MIEAVWALDLDGRDVIVDEQDPVTFWDYGAKLLALLHQALLRANEECEDRSVFQCSTVGLQFLMGDDNGDLCNISPSEGGEGFLDDGRMALRRADADMEHFLL